MTVQFISAVPILRIFDIAKADEFYQGFLGFWSIGIIASTTTRRSTGRCRAATSFST